MVSNDFTVMGASSSTTNSRKIGHVTVSGDEADAPGVAPQGVEDHRCSRAVRVRGLGALMRAAVLARMQKAMTRYLAQAWAKRG